MNKIYFNGEIIEKSNFKIGLDNRAFNYGDGVFETIKVLKGIPLFLKLHYSRMILALNAFNFDIPEEWSYHFYERIIEKLIKENDLENGILKIHFSRKPGGKYTPITNLADTLIYFTSEDFSEYQYYESDYKIDVFKDFYKTMQKTSAFKSINSNIYVQASIFAQNHKLQNAIVLNEQERVADAANANVFVKINNFWITPAIEEGGVDGILRRVLKKLMKQNKIELFESPISLQDLESASEIFLTNVVGGIIAVSHYKTKQLKTENTKILIELLQQKVNSILK